MNDPSHQFYRWPELPHLELRVTRNTRDCYQLHTHAEYSLGTIDAGEAVYLHRQERVALRAGMSVLIQPGVAHACNPDPAQAWSYRMAFVCPDWVQRQFGERAVLQRHFDAQTHTYHGLDALFQALLRRAPALQIDEMLLGFLRQHLVLPHTSTALDPGAMGRVRARIHSQLAENLGLDALAQACGLSGYQLIRQFKQVHGQTPHAYQLDQRIQQAKTLLRAGSALSEVAYGLGFADQAHFQRHFKNRTATTPKTYSQPRARMGSGQTGG